MNSHPPLRSSRPLPRLAEVPRASPVVAVGGRGALGLGALSSLVVGSMIGSGVFSLPQNMAAGAGAGAILLGWAVTAVGMLSLALMFVQLSRQAPDAIGGVYGYARAGFGDFVGFNSAWGYWLSAVIGNAGYLIIIFSSLAYFLPNLGFGDGNTAAGIAGASVLLWLYHALVLRGVKSAAAVNTVVTLAKLVPLALFGVLVALAFQARSFSLDFWGSEALGPVFGQVKSTMLVTVWAFIGIEGAAVFSGRAREPGDVGRATVIGFLLTIVLYMAITLLSLGVVPQAELAAMKNPSTAAVLERAVGSWGAVLMLGGVLLSVGGAMLSWTMLAAEVPFSAGKERVFPAAFERENAQGAPTTALWWSNGVVQLMLLLSFFAGDAYLALIKLATSTILVPYLLCALFALKLSLRKGGAALGLTGGVATVYSLWLLYAAGPIYLLLTALIYAPGLAVHAWSQRAQGRSVLRGAEWALAAVLVAAAAATLAMLANGSLDLAKI
ncbi:basic amino acid/polyamine antiporter [Ideonella azotifigens]|uniref:basic amino acid/polyamine antiporter n=1 Tax=Ideonella azotifigens TaxID=513160 RepID=UPI0011433E93